MMRLIVVLSTLALSACTYNLNIQRLYVLFDATAGTVRGTMTRDELFGHEGITLPCVR